MSRDDAVATDHDHLVAWLHGRLPAGTAISEDCTVEEVRAVTGAALVMVTWTGDPHRYGIRVGFEDLTHEYYYTDLTVDSVEEWLDSVLLGLMIQTDTGLRASAARLAGTGFVELRAEGGWPSDLRFYPMVLAPGDRHGWSCLPWVEASGIDPAVALAHREAGALVAWVLMYENNITGTPYVAQAVVTRDEQEPTTAHVEILEVVDAMPDWALVDLAHLAAHVATEKGALRVTTDHHLPELRLAGFVGDPRSRRTLDTAFLDTDPAGAAALLETSLGVGRWGQDRDAAGRYLPRG